MGWISDEGAYRIARGDVDFLNDTIKVRPSISTETPSRTATSMTGLGIAGYDVTVGSKTITKDTSNHRAVFDFADPTFTAVAAQAAAIDKVLVFKFSTDDAGSTFLGVATASASVTANGGNVAIAVDALGIFYLQN